MSNIVWGAERDVLLTIYKTLVLSRIDYGSIIYSSARTSRLKLLDPIQNTALRLATGAFRTSPIMALEVEAGIPSLWLRRDRLITNYATNIKAQPHHPNYAILFESDNHVFEARPTITKPLPARLNREIVISDIYPKAYPTDPPWQYETPICRLECASFRKHDTSPAVLKTSFLNLLYQYPEAEAIYTDGSKTDNGVGCSFIVNSEVHSWALPAIASVYTAEMYSIWQALLYCEFSKNQVFLICTDSLSSIQSIQNVFNTEPIAQTILSLLQWLRHNRKKIIFIFTPSHVGILGNEKADLAARLSADNNEACLGIPIREKDMKVEIKKIFQAKWQNRWNESATSYKRIHPTVNMWKDPIKLNRREQTVLTRLRISHTHLTSLHLLSGDRPPRCPTCEVTITAEHLLVNCPLYIHFRQAAGLENNIVNILANDKGAIKKILKFLRESGLFRKI